MKNNKSKGKKTKQNKPPKQTHTKKTTFKPPGQKN